MTDELVWERLAISIVAVALAAAAHCTAGVRSLAQLYPALISPFFLDGVRARATCRTPTSSTRG